jgi:hypothetical protein
MASSLLENNSALQDRILKTVALPIQVKIVGNATAASKVSSSDLPGVVLAVAAGQTSLLPSGVTTVTPADATGLYSIVLDSAAIGSVNKVISVAVVDVTGTHTAAISLSNGHIVVDIDSSVDLTGANTSELKLVLTYIKK